MGIAAVKIKIMPESPSSNLENIKKEAEKLIIKGGGKNPSFTEEPIAFGLKAIIAFFAWNESAEIESLEEDLKKIKEVNSIQIVDMRRAFG
ncbi:MAG: elongation factor 1-beta [archaeon]|nr:elongation factor 1-beta [archaeon]